MANIFKNTGLALVPITNTDIYTCPLNTTAIVHTIQLANVDPSFSVTATISVYDDSAIETRIVGANLPIAPGGALAFEKPVNLEQNDKLIVKSNVINRLSVNLSILEIT